jgi:hypothetical protein
MSRASTVVVDSLYSHLVPDLFRDEIGSDKGTRAQAGSDRRNGRLPLHRGRGCGFRLRRRQARRRLGKLPRTVHREEERRKDQGRREGQDLADPPLPLSTPDHHHYADDYDHSTPDDHHSSADNHDSAANDDYSSADHDNSTPDHHYSSADDHYSAADHHDSSADDHHPSAKQQLPDRRFGSLLELPRSAGR